MQSLNYVQIFRNAKYLYNRYPKSKLQGRATSGIQFGENENNVQIVNYLTNSRNVPSVLFKYDEFPFTRFAFQSSYNEGSESILNLDKNFTGIESGVSKKVITGNSGKRGEASIVGKKEFCKASNSPEIDGRIGDQSKTASSDQYSRQKRAVKNLEKFGFEANG